MLRRTFLLTLAVLPAACDTLPTGLSLAPNSTLILARHGEPAGPGVGLHDTGKARAEALIGATRDLGITQIFTPGTDHSIETAAPLSKALGKPIQRLSQAQPTGALVQTAALGPVIWIGKEDTIRRIWKDLSLASPVPLDVRDLTILRSDATGAVTIERRVYGPT